MNKKLCYIWAWICLVTASILIWMQVPRRIHEIKVNREIRAIELLEQREIEVKEERQNYEDAQNELHDTAKTLRKLADDRYDILCELDEKYCEEAIEVADILYERTYENIVIHHTATDIVSIEDMKKSMIGRFWTYPCHYIIWDDWKREKVAPLWERVWATMNEEYNRNGIHIELIGNFNKVAPTEAQKKSVEYLISEINKKHPSMSIIWHNEVPWSPTSCPWEHWTTFVSYLRSPVFH